MKSNSNTLPEIDSLWDYNQPEVTRQKFKSLLDDVDKETNRSYEIELLTQIARTYSLESNFEKAHSILDQASVLVDNESIIPKIRYNLERGRTFNSDNKKEKAVNQLKKAYDLALDNKEDFYTIDAAHMLGIAEIPAKQLEWNLIALEHTEETKDQKAKKWQGALYNNIAWTYHDKGDFEKALTYFEKALIYRQGQKDTSGIFVAKWMVGRTYRSMERIEEAIELQMKLLKEMEAGNVEVDGYVYEELAECFYIQKETEKSKLYFKKAYDLLSQDKWLVTNEAERLKRMKELGE